MRQRYISLISIERLVTYMYNELRKIYEMFQSQGIEDPFFETLHLANILAGGALNTVDMSLRDMNPDPARVVRMRQEGVPMEYILGAASFAGLRLKCTEKTIVPTEYTRLLVDVVVDFIEKRQLSVKEQTIIDVGTGCGNIAIAIALRTENVKILATDISPEALEIAQTNLDTYNSNEKIDLVCGDLFSPFQGGIYEGKIDIIISNPPYIPTSSLNKMPREVIEFQPRIALDAGPYGLDFYQRLVRDSGSMLKSGGILVFEVGEGQDKLVNRILSRHGGYEDIRYYKDQDGTIRVCSAVKKQTEHASA
jgi:release factor glutamine methyltransferase